MVAYASFTAKQFLETPDDAIFARLVRSDSVSGFSQLSHNQGWSWVKTIPLLREACRLLISNNSANSEVGVVLEYRIPRREKRLDAAFLFKSTLAVIEFKAGSSASIGGASTQVSDYCLDLAYYHARSIGKTIILIVCTTESCPSQHIEAPD